MNDEELNKLVEAWVKATNAEEGSSIHEDTAWASIKVISFTLGETGGPDLLWRFVLATYQRKDLSDLTFGTLAAVPLEDLLSKFGAAYIDRIEELARKDPKFNHLLGGVWQLTTPDEIWKRVEKARLKSW